MRILLFGLAAALLAAQTRNQLTVKEAAEGWILLYDGEGIFGWTPEGGAEWNTDPDGDLRARTGDSGDMVLNTVFGDYQLTCEIKAPVAKGSGLVLSGVSIPAPKPNDKYHPVSVTATGGKLVASVDGKKVLEQATSQPGTIVLHYRNGDAFAIRDLKLRPLGLQALFNGKDLTGWRAVPGVDAKVPPEWNVRNGMIHVVHGAGQLETERTFKDFVLQLEVRANSADPRQHPNSGVFMRGDSGAFWSGYKSQIRNEFSEGDRGKPVDFGTGGLYHYHPARKVQGNDNEFFMKTIVARGRHFAIWVNGVQVTDWDDPNPEGKTVSLTEARLAAGTISLQAHDPATDLDFKNVRIAELN
jgi:hypothetical protein